MNAEQRRAFYQERYGDEEGLIRFHEWQDKQEVTPEEAPKPQSGFIFVDEEKEKPKQRTRTTSRSRTKKVDPLSMEDATAVIAVAIAGMDKVAELVSPTWAQVPRLTGGDEILARYLDALTTSDKPEVERLASALAEAYGENQWLAKLFRGAQQYGKKGAPFVKLAIAAVSVFLPRLLALGLVPNPFGGSPPEQSADERSDVESGRAYGDSGNDREREIGVDGVPVGSVPQAVHRAQKQGGQRGVPTSANGHDSSADIAPEVRPMGTAPTFHGGP